MKTAVPLLLLTPALAAAGGLVPDDAAKTLRVAVELDAAGAGTLRLTHVDADAPEAEGGTPLRLTYSPVLDARRVGGRVRLVAVMDSREKLAEIAALNLGEAEPLGGRRIELRSAEMRKADGYANPGHAAKLSVKRRMAAPLRLEADVAATDRQRLQLVLRNLDGTARVLCEVRLKENEATVAVRRQPRGQFAEAAAASGGVPMTLSFRVPKDVSSGQLTATMSAATFGRNARPGSVTITRLLQEGDLKPSFGLALGPAAGGGVAVTTAVPGGAAEAEGVRDGDVLLSVDGVPPRDVRDTVRLLGRVEYGGVARLRLRRGGEVVSVDVPAE